MEAHGADNNNEPTTSDIQFQLVVKHDETNNIPCCTPGMDIQCLKNRKNKPPNLQLMNKHNITTDDSCVGEDETSSCESSPLVTLRKKVTKTLDAGAAINSPMIKRSSRLDQILEIPDVAAALVHDEGYEMLMQTRRISRGITDHTSVAGRPQTPKVPPAQFSFDDDTVGGDSESTSSCESIVTNIVGTPPPIKPLHAYFNESPVDIGANKSPTNLPLDLIADNTSVSKLFASTNSIDDDTMNNTRKLSHKLSASDSNTSTPTPTPKSSRKFFQRLKSSISRSSSSSSIEGWESLSRALARVGTKSKANPLTLTSILKTRIESHISDDSVTQDPAVKPSMHKKTVSFSRLPSESCVKNASDCVNLMQVGHQFVKMRSNSRVYNRLYWLDDVSNCLRWEPSKKDSGKARIDVSSIREVRPGKTTELFLSSDISAHFPDECSFSIVYADVKTLDLIANSPDDANVWITGLRCLMNGQDMDGLRMRTDHRDSWLGSTFDDADINKDGYLDEQESFKLITSLSDGVRELQVKQKLQEHLQLKGTFKSVLSRDEFIEIFKDVATRPEIYFLLARYSSGDDRLTLDDLHLFLESEQGMTNIDSEYCKSLIHEFEPSLTMKEMSAMGIDGFTRFLMSDKCCVFNPVHNKVCQDMNFPLSHYFIASSHNTYVMEDQVNGPSSVSAYVRALLRCCRCVELDCWDGDNGEPVITHGHTPTNKIPFRQVIEAINESAFRNSPYPVILCIENHCSELQQLVMASDLKQILADKIYTENLAKGSSQLPSPESLQRKILIRSKKLPLECDEEVGYVTDEDEGLEVDDQSPASPPIHVDTSSHTSSEGDCKRALVRDLSNLVSICTSVRFNGFATHERIHKCHATSSIHEQEAAKLVENEAGDFVNFTKKFLTRVYPSGVRMDSSNFNPQDFWNCGVQIASLNYQTPGLMMDINDGRFAMNGGCGYVLKPSIMREKLAYFGSEPRDTIPGVAPKILHLRIISGQNFPKPRGGGAKGQVIDPYVLIELFGLPNDCSEQRTRTAPNNSGDSPLFDESFEFRLSLPSLALVRFVVLDDEFIGDEFIGQYTIPFDCLLPGYRHLRLRSIFDEPLENATLFVHVAITDTDNVPSTFTGSTGTLTNSINIRGAGKRSSAGKKTRKSRSKKDGEATTLKEVGLPVVDDIFKAAFSPLRSAMNLIDTQRWSLSHFRETCGMAPFATVKQCIRALSQRLRSDTDLSATNRPKRKHSVAADGERTDDALSKAEMRRRAATADVTTARLRRQASDASQSSTESIHTTQQVSIVVRNLRLLLDVRGVAATNETWRKTAVAFESLITDTQAVIDKGVIVSDALSAVYKKAAKIHEDLPSFLERGDSVSDPSVDNNLANGSKKQKSNLKKKSSTGGDLQRRMRMNVEENFRWNCSVVRGSCDMLSQYRTEAQTLLANLWSAAVQYGLANKDENTSNMNEVKSVETNSNGNNNSPSHKPTTPTTPHSTKSSTEGLSAYPVTLL
ncbi:inactive phospholipase C-like protein 2 isoform X1 [Ciona intestinalis]